MAKELVTLYGLLNKLDDEFGWRRKELNVLKSKIPPERNSLQAVMLRSAIPLLYAHWEGFVKVAMSCYLEHVARKYLNNDKLNIKFLALSLQNKLTGLSVEDLEYKSKVIEILFAEYKKRSNVPKKNIVNTKSNLRFQVLKEILFILDLDDLHIDTKQDLIDTLVDTRNHIAHGEYNVVDLDTYEEYHIEIIQLMEFIKTKIENNATQELYSVHIPLIN